MQIAHNKMKKILLTMLIGLCLISIVSAGITRTSPTNFSIVESGNNFAMNFNGKQVIFSLSADGKTPSQFATRDIKLSKINERREKYTDKYSDLKTKYPEIWEKEKNNYKEEIKEIEVEWGWEFEGATKKDVNNLEISYTLNGISQKDVWVEPVYKKRYIYDDGVERGIVDTEEINNYIIHFPDNIEVRFLDGCKIEYISDNKFKINGDPSICADPISRSGSETTITGYKASGTATSSGNDGSYSTALPYLADNSSDRPLVEENIVISGTTDGDQRCTIPSGPTVDSLEDSGASFLTDATGGWLIFESTTQELFWVSAGIISDTCMRQTGNYPEKLATGDVYRIHGNQKLSPTDWSKAYQGNLLWIYAGTGAGQFKWIESVTNVSWLNETKFYIGTSWETEPDSTSQYRVLYSPADVVYNNAAAGNLLFDEFDKVLIAVELTDDLLIGNSGGTATGFGWANYMMYMNNNEQLSSQDYPIWMYTNADIVVGGFNPTHERTETPGFFFAIDSTTGSQGHFSDVSGKTPTLRLHNSAVISNIATTFKTGGTTPDYTYFTKGDSGIVRSYHNYGGAPFSTNSEGDYNKYDTVPVSTNLFPDFTAGTNFEISNAKMDWDGAGFHSTQALGQAWANALQASPGSSDFTWIDCNFDFEDYMSRGPPLNGLPASDNQGIWYGWHQSGANSIWTGEMYWKKTINIKVVDSDGDALDSADVRIYNWGKSYDSTTQTSTGGNITERTLTLGYFNWDESHTVYHNSLYYTATARMTSNESNEPGVGANWASYWSQSGSGVKFKWRNNTKYHETRVASTGWYQSGLKNYNPFSIDVQKSGYFTYVQTYDISLDSEGEDLLITLFKWYELEGYAYIVMDKVNNLIKFYKNG